MPPKPSNTLTEAELRIMRILWVRGESSVSELQAAMAEELAYNSVLTTVRILEQKGYVQHRTAGRAFLYTATVAEHEARRSEVRHVLDRFFASSHEQLVLSVLGEGQISAEELRRLKQLIAAAEANGPGDEDRTRARESVPVAPTGLAAPGEKAAGTVRRADAGGRRDA